MNPRPLGIAALKLALTRALRERRKLLQDEHRLIDECRGYENHVETGIVDKHRYD